MRKLCILKFKISIKLLFSDLLEYKLEEELAAGGRKGNKDTSGGIQGKSDSSM